MPEIIYGDQNTDEWFKLRLGSIGGSSISSVMAKSKDAKMRTGKLYELAGEILSGKKTETYESLDMKRGKLFEPEAREYYSFINDVEVEQCALIKCDIQGVHCSPDGLVGENGMVEIKVRIPKFFVQLKDSEKIEGNYRKQCQHSFWVSSREWVDFTNYCPEMPNPADITRIYRDEKQIEEIKIECLKFLGELNALVERMR